MKRAAKACASCRASRHARLARPARHHSRRGHSAAPESISAGAHPSGDRPQELFVPTTAAHRRHEQTEGRQLVGSSLGHATQEEFIFVQRWRKHDLVIWRQPPPAAHRGVPGTTTWAGIAASCGAASCGVTVAAMRRGGSAARAAALAEPRAPIDHGGSSRARSCTAAERFGSHETDTQCAAAIADSDSGVLVRARRPAGRRLCRDRQQCWPSRTTCTFERRRSCAIILFKVPPETPGAAAQTTACGKSCSFTAVRWRHTVYEACDRDRAPCPVAGTPCCATI
jgi:hypothetical protein